MDTDSLNKPSSFLFQDSTPRLSYPCERIVITTKYVKIIINAVENYVINNNEWMNELINNV